MYVHNHLFYKSYILIVNTILFCTLYTILAARSYLQCTWSIEMMLLYLQSLCTDNSAIAVEPESEYSSHFKVDLKNCKLSTKNLQTNNYDSYHFQSHCFSAWPKISLERKLASQKDLTISLYYTSRTSFALY